MAAAGAALENANRGRHSGSGISADEMSVDFSDGAAEDSNVEMGGIILHDREGNVIRPSGSEGGIPKKVPKKRMMKEDQYDKDDPFVDDTELAWEEQAAASRDGFFVYSGPLVPEGEKVVVERCVLFFPLPLLLFLLDSRNAGVLHVSSTDGKSYRADGVSKRGRGKGRGGSTRGAGKGGAMANGAPSTRGAPGTRKPRLSKALKLEMEREMGQRERMAVLAAKPTGYPG